jgi:hypothetical protein
MLPRAGIGVLAGLVCLVQVLHDGDRPGARAPISGTDVPLGTND